MPPMALPMRMPQRMGSRDSRPPSAHAMPADARACMESPKSVYNHQDIEAIYGLNITKVPIRAGCYLKRMSAASGNGAVP